jgi:hypothetical protein
MGSDLLMVVLPTPTDGSPPDWAAARAAVDQLTYDQLPEGLLDAVEAESDEAVPLDDEAAMLAEARARLHRHLVELQAAYGDDQEGMHQDLSFLHLFDRRMLVTGGPSWGGAPTELFDVLAELGDTGPVAAALSGDDKPVPPTASTPALDVGQVLEIEGFGRYTPTAEATLEPARADTPIQCRAEIGSVIYLWGLHHADGVHPQLGPGYFLIEQDYRDLEDEIPYPVLTALVQND